MTGPTSGGRCWNRRPPGPYEGLPARRNRRRDRTPGRLFDLHGTLTLTEAATLVGVALIQLWWAMSFMAGARGNGSGVASAIGMENDGRLLEEAATALAPGQLDADGPFEVGSVSSFTERHPAVTPQQYERIHDIETRLYLDDADGPDPYALLVAHAASGLVSPAI